jgi:hypothetical protein
MAEKQSSGLDLTGQISAVDANIKSIFDARKNIIAKLAEADKAGNTALAQQLADESVTLSRALERQETQYDLLKEQEAKPEQERIGKLGQELRQPYVSPPPRGYSPYGLMPNAPNTTRDQSDFPTRQEQTQRKRELVGQLYNAPAGDRKAEQLPTGVRAGVGALPTPEGELEFLKREYPNANIVPIDVGGQTEYLIKNPNNTSFTTLDKGIAGGAGMLAVEAPIAIGTAAAGIGTAIGTRSPVTATLAAGGTEAVLGTAADAITRAALGMPQQFGEDVSRRGLQAGIGMALGGVSDVAIPMARAARMPSTFQNEFLKTYQDSVRRLGLPDTAVPAGAQFGRQGLEAGQELSGQFPKSGIAASKRKAQESIRTLFENRIKDVPLTPNDFSAIAVNQAGQKKALANSISVANKKSSQVVEKAIDGLLKSRTKTNVDELGSIFRNTIEAAETQASKSKDDQYNVLADVAERAGFKITPKELLDIIKPIKARVNVGGAFDDSAVKSVEKRLRKVNEPLDFRAFDAYIRAFNDARPTNAVGGKTKDAFGAGVAAELSELRRDIYSRFNAANPDGTVSNLGDEFKIATDKVKARTAFEGNTLGGILRDVVGEQARTPRDIVSSVMKEPATINRVLQAVRELEIADPAEAGAANRLQEMMRLQYLNDLGMGSPKGVTSLNYDQGMLDSLYGNKSAAAARGLDSMNDKLRVLKSASVPDMTLTDLNALSSALSKDARDEVASGIIKRNALEKQEQDLVASSIFKAAKKGNFENIDPDLLSKSILSRSNTIGETKSVMAKLSQTSPESRNLFKGDFVRNLLDEYPGGEFSAGAPYTQLFDAKKFLADWESPTGKSQFAQKVETVLGQKDAQFFYDLAKVYEGATIADVTAKGFDGRLVGSPTGGTYILPITPIISRARNRYLAAMLTTGSDRYGLKSALARNALPGEVNDAYLKMYKNAFLTRQGLTALANQASSDPEFSAELQNAVREFEEKEGLDLGGK